MSQISSAERLANKIDEIAKRSWNGSDARAIREAASILRSFHVAQRPDYVRGLEDAALIVERWSLPTIQTPSMWLVDKAGIAADIRALSQSSTGGDGK